MSSHRRVRRDDVMRVWWSIMAASFLLPFLYQPLALADSISAELDNPIVQGSNSYWTSKRYKDARPLPLPIPDNSLEVIGREQEDIDTTPEDGTPPVGEEGQGPTLRVPADWKNRLFEEDSLTPETAKEGDGSIPDDILRPSNVGTQGAHFSSSRLVPTSADRTYPYRAVGKLFFTTPQGEFVCSGSVISHRLVLTAGHCVHSGSGGTSGFYQNFRFAPAYRDGTAPYQTWTAVFVIVTGTWATGNGNVPNAADYALLEMQDQSGRKIGQVTGFLGFRTQSLTPNHAHLLGYPVNLDKGGKMHQVTAGSFSTSSNNTVLYGSDMSGGSSGGPWVQNFGAPASGQTGGSNAQKNQVIGVTSFGFTSTAPLAQGSSIFDSRFTQIRSTACSHRSGNC